MLLHTKIMYVMACAKNTQKVQKQTDSWESHMPKRPKKLAQVFGDPISQSMIRAMPKQVRFCQTILEGMSCHEYQQPYSRTHESSLEPGIRTIAQQLLPVDMATSSIYITMHSRRLFEMDSSLRITSNNSNKSSHNLTSANFNNQHVDVLSQTRRDLPCKMQCPSILRQTFSTIAT